MFVLKKSRDGLLLMLLVLASFGLMVPVQAQDSLVEDTAREMLSQAELDVLKQGLHDALERIAPLVAEIDTRAAEDWLSSHPRERLEERVQASAERPAEQAVWQSALEHITSARERLRGALERVSLARAYQERLQRGERLLDEMIEARRSTRPLAMELQGRSLTAIEDDIVTLESRRTQLLLEREQKRQTLTRLEEQARTQQEALDPTGRDSLSADLEPLPANVAEDPLLQEAIEAWDAARDARMQARVLALQLDSQTLRPRMDILRLELRILEAMSLWLETRLRGLRQDLDARADEDLRALRQEIRRLGTGLADPRSEQALQVRSLLERIDTVERTQQRMRLLRANRDYYERLEADVQQSLAGIEERLAIGGMTEALGRLLLQEERRMRGLLDLRRVQRDLERELTQSRLRDLGLRDELRALRPAAVASLPVESEQPLLLMQQQVLETQLQIEEQLTELLAATEARLLSLVNLVEAFSRLLRESLLWWPSHPPVSVDWALMTPLAVLALFDLQAWQGVPMMVQHVTVESPVTVALTLFLAAFLWLWGRKMPGKLRKLAEKTRHRYTDSIMLTFKAIGWSLLRVTPMPMLIALTAWRLERVPDLSSQLEFIPASLYFIASWWLAGHLAYVLTGKNSVGLDHLGWNPLILRRLRFNLSWYLPIQLLLIIALAFTFGHPSELVSDVFSRASLVASVVVTALFALRMFRPLPEQIKGSQSDRRRKLVRLAVTAFAVILIVLILAGYLLTVSQLLQLTINSVLVIGAVWLGYSLAARALVLTETRLVMRRMREQRAQAAAMEASGSGEGAPVDIPEPHLSLEDVNQQTRSLMRVSAGAGLVLGLLWVWSDALPALIWLDGVTLWTRTIMVGETEILSRVSLQDFLLAGFLGVIFTLAARNLPGLVEILLTRSTLMDASARYTVTTLLRYVLAVVAVISVFSLLGLRWSELQWMVAALTLGLGFGLQEVVANFVSGLIMLFERPVRVGDIITIGEYSGVVTRIRTRATTIMDWDNREVLIPNKAFITERLINWTLSDTVTRMVIPVGVSYQADVDQVLQTLTRIAQQHPLVLKDPEPSVLFLQFGDSALNFELRVYVGQLSDRMTTLSQLHQTIMREFRREGIEIAYPQMDLHIRDMTPLASGSGPALG